MSAALLLCALIGAAPAAKQAPASGDKTEVSEAGLKPAAATGKAAPKLDTAHTEFKVNDQNLGGTPDHPAAQTTVAKPATPPPPAQVGVRAATSGTPAEAGTALPTPPSADASRERSRPPVDRPRFQPPGEPAPQVGYAPQVAQPLPAYPGVGGGATSAAAYPAQVSATGPLANLYTDLKACKVGDVLTIVIAASASANSNADKSSTKDTAVNFGGGTGVLSKMLPAMGGSYTGSNKGTTKDTSGFNVGTTFTVTVVGVAPTGNLMVEGQQVVNIDGRDQWVKIKGEVRPYDVTPANTVDSTRVANVRIEYLGIRGQRKRKGFFDVIGGAFETLLGWLF